jgi:4-diphosphocytidyl-2-C-methyl-D-erythritol kinase
MKEYALQLGSDCPFFIMNKPCLATGRGEIMKEIELDLSTYNIVIINPGIHINTREAFLQLKQFSAPSDLENLVKRPVNDWKDRISNDFEEAVFAMHPAIALIKAKLYDSGAIYASMSGSGSSVYGIFKKKDRPPLNFSSNYFLKWL